MQNTAATVDEYLETVEPERLPAMTSLRQACRTTLVGDTEGMQHGMPYYYSKDNGAQIAFNSQKNYISLYGVRQEVKDRYRDHLKDSGTGCIRYRHPEQIDFAIVELLLRETVDTYAQT